MIERLTMMTVYDLYMLTVIQHVTHESSVTLMFGAV